MTLNPPEKIPVVVAVGDFASGVTSWALRLRETFADHPAYTILLMNCAVTRNRIAAFDLEAASFDDARQILRAFDEAIVVPNFVWDLFPVCAGLNALGHHLRCVGFCRADSEREYYAPLRWYAPLASRFAAVSPECAQTLAKHLDMDASAIHTLPSGVHVPAALNRTWQARPIRLAYGGRIVQEQKRVLDFVPLVARLYALGVDFSFDIAGAGPQLDELKSALAPVDPDRRVRFVPRMPPEAMPTFWANHDVFVQLSEFEGTSNSMLESMAQGTVPVIGRTSSGVDSIIVDGSNGFLIAPGDVSGMAKMIAAMASDPGRLTLAGAKAHAAMQPFTMDRYVEKFTRLLDDTLASPLPAWPEGRPMEPPTPFFGIRLNRPAPDSQRGRIAIVFPSPLRGGAEDYTLTIAAGAARAAYDVQGCFPAKSALNGLIHDYQAAGAFHNTLEICDVGPRTGQAPVYKRFTRAVRLLRRLRPRAVLFMLCGMQYGLASLLACAALNLPTLVVFQLVRGDIRFSPPRRGIHRLMRVRGQRYVAVSEANRLLLARAFRMESEAILLIPNGVDTTRFAYDNAARAAVRSRIRSELGLPPDAVLCLTVGRLAHQKGHDILVPAIPHIAARFPTVHFLWAGEGPAEKSLRRQLEVYRAAAQVTLLGKRDDIPDLLNACDLFVHPARFEGQPFSLLEAMAAGLPVASTAASGIPELVEDGKHGYLCRPDDIAALRDMVLDALGHPEESARMAEVAREHAADFSKSVMVAKTLAALEAVADAR